MLDDRDRQFLQDVPFFRELPAEEREYFLNSAHCMTYPRHSLIHEQGSEIDGFDTVLEGWVRLYRTTRSGKMASPIMLTPGDTYGQSLIILGYKRYLYNAFTMRPVRIARIPARIVEERATENPGILLSVNRALFSRMMSTLRKSEHMALMSAEQRVACHLLYLCADRQGTGATFPVPYDKYEIAHHLGLSAESFSRALKKLEEAGVYVRGSEITISRFSRLARICQPDCAAGRDECRCAWRLPPDER